MGFNEILRLSGLSQKEFAERYHVPFSTVNRWVNGGKQPPYVLALLERFVREDAMGDNEIPWVYGIGIKRIIESSHMSIKDFAVKYGISEPLLRNWLSAKKQNGYILYLLERAVKEDNRKG